MQSVRWVTCAVSNAITRTIIHFFPAANITNAPYPVSVRLTIFGRDSTSRSITIEGGRLGQPDGIRLEDAFPEISEGVSGFMGVEIELLSIQPRIDLRYSSCIVEFVSSGQGVRYALPNLPSRGELKRNSGIDLFKQKDLSRSIIAMQDALSYTSLVLLNLSENEYKPKLLAQRADSSERELIDIGAESLPPFSAREHQFNDAFYAGCEPIECTWGLARSRFLLIPNEQNSDGKTKKEFYAFVVYRDSVSKRIISVVPV